MTKYAHYVGILNKCQIKIINKLMIRFTLLRNPRNFIGGEGLNHYLIRYGLASRIDDAPYLVHW